MTTMNRSLMLQGPSGVRTSSRTIKAGESMTHTMALQELQEFRRTSTRETDHVQRDVEMRDSHGSDSNNGTGSNTTASGDDGAEDDGGGAYERGDVRRSLEREAKRTRIDRFDHDDAYVGAHFATNRPTTFSSLSSSPPAQEHHDAACGDVAQVSSAPMLLNDDPRCPRLLTCAGLHDTGRGHGATSTPQSAAGPAAGSNAQSSTAAGAPSHQGRTAQGPEAPDVDIAHAILCRGVTRCSMHARVCVCNT